MPDTDNLLRLAEYYGVTLDELTARAPRRDEASDKLLEPERGNGSSRMPLPGFWLCVPAVAAYFVWLAQPLLLSTMDDITEMFGLVPGTALAVAWFCAEILFITAPFLVMAMAPVRLPRWAWTTPLVVFAALTLPPLLAWAIGGAQFMEYTGVGGALKASVVMKADVLAIALACTVLALRQRGRSSVHLTSASS